MGTRTLSGQQVIVYKGESGKLWLYSTAYTSDQVKAAIDGCAKRYGWRCGAQSMPADKFAAMPEVLKDMAHAS